MKNKTKWSLAGKKFRLVSSNDNGEVSDDTIFYYQQNGNIFSAQYNGGGIREGNLLGQVQDNGLLQFRYQHWNTNNEFRSGICTSRPERLPNGKLRLHESWEWTGGLKGKGKSIVEEC